MIPKKIHYFWSSEGEVPDSVKNCIESWKKYLPQYEIIKWDSKNFDMSCNTYVQEAFSAKKWAFVSDYVRLSVLYQYGGIYFDTDVEVKKSFDNLMNLNAFCGFERLGVIGTCVLACEPGNEIIGQLLKEYEEIHFLNEDNEPDLTPNTHRLSEVLKEYGMTDVDQEQYVGNLTIFPRTYFTPFNPYVPGNKFSKETYSIHHFDGAWLDAEDRNRMNKKKQYMKIWGSTMGPIIFGLVHNMKEGGVNQVLAKIKKHLGGGN